MFSLEENNVYINICISLRKHMPISVNLRKRHVPFKPAKLNLLHISWVEYSVSRQKHLF